MMRKARGRPQRLRGELALLPTAERLAHGPIEPMSYQIIDSRGDYARPLRALDTLARMERAGTISEPEARAGNKFHDLFRCAALDHLYASDPMRTPVVLANGNNGKLAEGSEAARLAVRSALDALGGIFSPTGSCAWCCLGLEMSLKDWVKSRAPPRRIDLMLASGILVADLTILRAHFNC